MDATLKQCCDLDKRLVDAAKGIKVLSQLGWPSEVGAEFLANWGKGQAKLPQPPMRTFDYSRHIDELTAIMRACDRTHPIGSYIHQTALSYVTAARMLQELGKPSFTELSAELYGTPADRIGASTITNLIAAEHFIKATEEFGDALHPDAVADNLSAETVASELERQFRDFFKDHAPAVVIDPNLTSKAAAGAQRVRIRGGAMFSSIDVGQLAQHEGFVHAATMLNGREQPNLKSMGLGAPRTTGTQEGLATFAELITNTMDLARLRRIALRIKAMHLAIEGADFLDVFDFFLQSGQDETESYQSAARIFRGGNPQGGTIFTKDVVYLQGLMFLHTFLRKAIQTNKYEYARFLFLGRLTLGDIIAFEPFIKSGFIKGPSFIPEWARNQFCLAAYLCYSIFANRINVGSVKLSDFSDHEHLDSQT